MIDITIMIIVQEIQMAKSFYAEIFVYSTVSLYKNRSRRHKNSHFAVTKRIWPRKFTGFRVDNITGRRGGSINELAEGQFSIDGLVASS